MLMKKLLITGFDAFAHYQINPSWEAVKSLPEEIGPFKLTKMRLPNIYGLEWKMLLEKAQQIQPDVILLTGMDSGSTRLHLDTVAINLRDALVEDNLGRTPWNEAIIAGGPTAYFATLPVHDIIKNYNSKKFLCISVMLAVVMFAMMFFIWPCIILLLLLLKSAFCTYRCCRKWFGMTA